MIAFNSFLHICTCTYLTCKNVNFKIKLMLNVI